MVNTEAFTKRLNKIIDYYDLSAASFADKIDVGRSSISHLLSGRNKPSLDFVMKVVNAFPEVELYWLLNGKGNFPKKENTTPPPSIPIQSKDHRTNSADLFSEKVENEFPVSYGQQNQKKQIEKVVIFYNDGTFEAYQNS